MLAERIEWIEKWPFYSSDEDLRKEIYKAVSSRIKELGKTLRKFITAAWLIKVSSDLKIVLDKAIEED